MKRILSLVLVLVLMSSLCCTAFAQTAPVETPVVAVVNAVAAPEEVEWTEISDVLRIQIPDSFVENRTTEENALASYTDTVTGNTISVVKLDTTETLDEMFKGLVDEGKQDKLVKLNLNGLAAYALMEDDGSYIVVVEVDGELIQFTFTGADDADYQRVIEKILASVTAAD